MLNNFGTRATWVLKTKQPSKYSDKVLKLLLESLSSLNFPIFTTLYTGKLNCKRYFYLGSSDLRLSPSPVTCLRVRSRQHHCGSILSRIIACLELKIGRNICCNSVCPNIHNIGILSEILMFQRLEIVISRKESVVSIRTQENQSGS